MRRPALLAAAAGLLVVAIGALAWWAPFVRAPRDYPATIPQTVPLFTTPLVALRHGQQVCFSPAVMDRRSEQPRFRAATPSSPTGGALALTIAGPGYRYAARVPGGYANNSLLTVPVRPPPRDIATRICLRNEGRPTIALFGVDDRTRAPLTVTRDGRRIGPAVQFAFFEARPTSIARRLPTTLDRMQAFRPGLLGPWLFWPLLLLCLGGLPLGAVWAVSSAVGRSED